MKRSFGIVLLATACASTTPGNESQDPATGTKTSTAAEAPKELGPDEAPGKVVVAAEATAQELFDAIRWFAKERDIGTKCWIHVPDDVPLGLPIEFGAEGKTFAGKLTCNPLTATNWVVGRNRFMNVAMSDPSLNTNVVFAKYGPVGTTYDKAPGDAETGTQSKAPELDRVALKSFSDSVTLIVLGEI